MRRLLALAVVGWASLASSDVPAPKQQQCRADTECTLTTFSGCCGSCCPSTRAMSLSELQAEQSRCARSKILCPNKNCVCNAEPEPPTVARCRQGLCVAVPVEVRQPSAAGACSTDTECVITTFSGCCGGVPCPSAHAVSRRQLEQNEQRCRAIDCRMPEKRDLPLCKATLPASAFRAVCRAGACTAERATAQPVGSECTSPADCTVRYAGPGPDAACRSSPCGCCPGGEPMAVPARSRTVPLTRPPPTNKPAPGSKVPWGLSDGRTNAPPPPNCSPCPAPQAASATCVSGRCVLAPDRPHILE